VIFSDGGLEVMPKNCLEDLAEWSKEREASKSRKDKSIVAFLAVRADVKVAIEAGYALKTVWQYLRERKKISYRYETFLRHVRRYIMQNPTSKVKGSTLEQKAEIVEKHPIEPIPTTVDMVTTAIREKEDTASEMDMNVPHKPIELTDLSFNNDSLASENVLSSDSEAEIAAFRDRGTQGEN
jgi:hypothetical protein